MTKVLTQFAEHANTIAVTFRAAFVKRKLGDCTIDMTAPEGSTDGGRLGMQHVTLRTPEGLSIVLGIIHAGDKRAELRSFDVVARLFEDRFKKPPPFTEATYQLEVVERTKPILAAFGLDVSVIDDLPESPSTRRLDPVESLAPPPKRGLASWGFFVVAFLAIIAATAYLTLRNT